MIDTQIAMAQSGKNLHTTAQNGFTQQFGGIPDTFLLFGDYYRDTCKISKADMIAFLKANSLYTIKRKLSETRAKVKIVVGAKEQKRLRDSAVLLNRAIPGSCMEILPGLRHGDLSLNKPEQYVKILTDWIGE